MRRSWLLKVAALLILPACDLRLLTLILCTHHALSLSANHSGFIFQQPTLHFDTENNMALTDNNNGSDQSESMGRSDVDEEEIPMKQPAAGDGGANNTNYNNDGGADDEQQDESFLDDDFLSFGNVDNGGMGDAARSKTANGGNAQRLPPMMPSGNNAAYPMQQRTPRVPWLDNAAATLQQNPPPPPQQQQWGRNNRGYNNNQRQYNHAPPPLPPRTPPLIRLHNEIVSFAKLMSPTAEELEVRNHLVERVTRLAHGIFGGEDRVSSSKISLSFTLTFLHYDVLPFA